MIEENSTIAPNGYNLNVGGANGKDSIMTREKKRLMRLGKQHSEKTKTNISKRQMGNRRETKKRKHKEDELLPKYVSAKRVNGTIIGYSVDGFPIGIKKKEYYPFKIFRNAKNPENALNDALQFLESLKEKYAHVEQEMEIQRKLHEEERKKEYFEKEIQKKTIDLPDNIFPLYGPNNKHIGYYVEGLTNINGEKIPRKDFDGAQALVRNLKSAKNWITQCMINDNNVAFTIPPLPKHCQRLNDKNKVGKVTEGFRIKNFPVKLKDGTIKKFNKKFTNMALSMEEKYNDLMSCYESLQKGIIPEDTGRKTYFREH